jgi:hypothetical protein
MPVDITEPFSSIFARLSAQKPEVSREHATHLNVRYDLSKRPGSGVTMDRTKPVQEGGEHGRAEGDVPRNEEPKLRFRFGRAPNSIDGARMA